MTRSLDPTDLITLPRVDANGSVALARALEASTLDDKDKPRKLPEHVKAALVDLSEDRQALQDALGTAPAPAPVIKSADLIEDNAVGTLSDLLAAWARLAGKIPQGDVAAKLHERLFSDGLGFLNLKSIEEWGVVETKLQTIEREKLGPSFEQLGAKPVLDHLREVHAHYGKVTGATKAAAPVESPEIRARYDALLASLRHYVGAVVGSIIRRKPETKTLADTLLNPLAEWKPSRSRAKAAPEEETPAPAPKAPAAGG